MVGMSTAVRRAELQQEGGPARGHESHGNIGAKQKRGQPYDGRYIGSPSVPEPSLHDLGAPPCQSQRHCSTGAHAAAFIALIPERDCVAAPGKLTGWIAGRVAWARLAAPDPTQDGPSAPCMRSFNRRVTDTRLTPEPTEFHQLLAQSLQMASPWKCQGHPPCWCVGIADMHQVASQALFTGDRTCLN